MTFNRYDVSSRVIRFNFNAPISGGLTRLHYQPQFRRLPSTSWSNASFTVSATATSWALIFNNESFAAGRTIEFRLVAVCTGDVQSAPSNVVSYTYPGPTITPTRTSTGPSPTRTRTPTRTMVPTDCRPPRNMTFNRYNASNRAVYFNFNAPLSGGLTRLHYQPQYRRLPSTSWLTTPFTVSATATTWNIIFGESFSPGRTIEFRLLAICTGDVLSNPSNVVSYTYPGATITPTRTISRPSRTSTRILTSTRTPTRTRTATRTSTIGPSPTSAACPAPTNLRFTRFSNSNVSIRWNGVDVDLPTAFISVSPNPSDEGDDVRLIMRTENASYYALYWNGALLFDSSNVPGFEQLDYNTLFEDIEYTTGRVDIRLVARNDIGQDEATEIWIVNQRADCLAPTNFRRNVAYERSGALDIRSRYTWTVNPVSDSITTGYVFQYREYDR